VCNATRLLSMVEKKCPCTPETVTHSLQLFTDVNADCTGVPTGRLVGWSLTSLFSTNMAISETSTHNKDQVFKTRIYRLQPKQTKHDL